MTERRLQVLLCGELSEARHLQELLTTAVSAALKAHPDVPQPLFSVERTPNHLTAGAYHLVIGVGESRPRASTALTDISLTGADVEQLAESRLVPWAIKWHNNRRAPRAMTAVLKGPDMSWSQAAARLISRLKFHTTNTPVLRIDHIGSTSVPGLKAKDLIDIQVTVPKVGDSLDVGQAATAAGFVLVAGDWFGLDREGNEHPEVVVVDADPGRPANVNIRSAEAPVVRETLLYRDWLRAHAEEHEKYEDFKAKLASSSSDVDDYGSQKQTFISEALELAETWAAATSWLA